MTIIYACVCIISEPFTARQGDGLISLLFTVNTRLRDRNLTILRQFEVTKLANNAVGSSRLISSTRIQKNNCNQWDVANSNFKSFFTPTVQINGGKNEEALKVTWVRLAGKMEWRQKRYTAPYSEAKEIGGKNWYGAKVEGADL